MNRERSGARSVDLSKNTRWGLYWGLCGAVVYSIIAVLLYLVRGSEPFSKVGTTFGMTLGAYLAGGLAAGLVLGLLRPLARWWWGAAIVGFWCAVPVWTAAFLAFPVNRPVDATDVRMLVLVSMLSGPVVGVVAWRRFRGGRWPR